MVEIRKIGVIGAGQMGNGIAHVAALGGHEVVLHDISADRIEAGLATITGNLARQVQKGLIDDSARKAALDRISSGTAQEVLSDCDLVVEAATENEETKKKIYAGVCKVL